MIFVKVDVDLPGHHRLLRIPRGIRRASALGVWTAAICYTRMHELDGFVPAEALEGYATDESVSDLTSAGLMVTSSRDGIEGYEVCKYAEHNEVRAEILKRRKKDRVRKASAKIPRGIHADSDDVPEDHFPGFPDSDSDSDSVISPSLSSSLPAPSQDRHSGTTLQRSPAGDGAFGMAVQAWKEGVNSVHHGTTIVMGAELERLNQAIREGSTSSGEDPVSWARRLGEAFAREGGTMSVYRFLEFLAGGGGAKRPRAVVKAAPTPSADALTGDAAREQAERVTASLGRAGVAP